MKQEAWMIYGAYGFTGRLIVKEALGRGHRPLLAGRSAADLARLAAETGLDSVTVSLDDRRALTDVLRRVKLVMNAAGPFTATAGPMTRAALDAGTNYVDITGEIPALSATLALHDEALARGVALVPGAGFDVVPSDCLAAHVAQRLPGAQRLEIMIEATGRPTTGTIRSTLGVAAGGSYVLSNGRLLPKKLGEGIVRAQFFGAESTLLPAPIGDLVTAHRSTGIGDITTYLSLDGMRPLLVRVGLGLMRPLLGSRLGRRALLTIAERFVMKTEHEADQGSARIQVTAHGPDGAHLSGWLTTPAGYRLTAQTSVHAVELILSRGITGALTPAQAFGPDFALEFDGVRRSDEWMGR
jgi:short subunit dehydrogenase-like uncharacterized protein